MTTEELIEGQIPLIKHVASNFYNVSFEDLMQAGILGVLKAYKNYRKEGNIKFSTYAYDYIFGEMYDFTMKDREVKVSKELLRLAKKIELTKNTLALKIGRIPTYVEIGEFLNLSMFQIMEAISVKKASISFDNNSEEARSLTETIPCKEGLSLEEKLTLQSGIETLSDAEQKILEYRYFEDLSQSETAKRLGMTQVMVSRYENKSLKRLKSFYEVV